MMFDQMIEISFEFEKSCLMCLKKINDNCTDLLLVNDEIKDCDVISSNFRDC